MMKKIDRYLMVKEVASQSLTLRI
uniref:Uncharacterized protein n=1 Tax=Rhizophora mucronata TaxID=61149 RepID=A0A2P2LSK1_RHIMU